MFHIYNLHHEPKAVHPVAIHGLFFPGKMYQTHLPPTHATLHPACILPTYPFHVTSVYLPATRVCNAFLLGRVFHLANEPGPIQQ